MTPKPYLNVANSTTSEQTIPTIRLIALLFTLFVSACGTLEDSHKHDLLVGTFVGGNPDRKCGGMWWELARKGDGTYTILFFNDSKRTKPAGSESGLWWVKGDDYYLINPNVMEHPDVYHINILNDNEIEFTSKQFDKTATCKENYRFIDHRSASQ